MDNNSENNNTTYIGGVAVNTDTNSTNTGAPNLVNPISNSENNNTGTFIGGVEVNTNTSTNDVKPIPINTNSFINTISTDEATNLNTSTTNENNIFINNDTSYNEPVHSNDLSSYVTYTGKPSNTTPTNQNDNSMKVVGAFIALLILAVGALVVPGMLEKANHCTVTFLDMDGVYLVVENLEKNSPVTEPAAPERKGYEFKGWYLDGVIYDFNRPVTTDIYLNAKWLNVTTNEIEEISETKIQEYKESVKSTSTPKNNSGTSTKSTSNPKATATPKSNSDTSTQTPVATPTPVPVPTPAPGATTVKVILKNSKFSDNTSSKTLEVGQTVTIHTSTVFNNRIDTFYSGAVGCSTSADVGHVSYKIEHKYTATWTAKASKTTNLDSTLASDDPNDNELTFTVPDTNVTITASVKEDKIETDKRECYEYDATYTEEKYECNDGDTLDGTVCVHTEILEAEPTNTIKQCRKNDECPDGSICNSGSCQKYSSNTYTLTSCYSNDECPSNNNYCYHNNCVKRCADSSQCASGACSAFFYCINDNPADFVASTRCNSGDKFVNNQCVHEEFGDKIYETKCNTGYTLENGKCIKTKTSRYASKHTRASYSCDSGGKLSNQKCYNTRTIN